MMQVARAVSLTAYARRSGSGARLAGHGDGPVRDDVLLYLGGAAADGRVALEGEQPRPFAAVHRVGPALGEHTGRSEQIDGELGHRLRHLRPRQLGEGDLGPVLL